MDAQGRQRCVQEYFPHLSSSPIIIIIVVQTIHDERQIKLKLNLEFGAKYFGPSDELNSTQSKVGGSVLLSTLLITLSSSSSFSYVFTLAATIMVSCCCLKRNSRCALKLTPCLAGLSRLAAGLSLLSIPVLDLLAELLRDSDLRHDFRPSTPRVWLELLSFTVEEEKEAVLLELYTGDVADEGWKVPLLRPWLPGELPLV